MAITQASWVHGTALQLEAAFPVEVLRRGWGSVVRSPGGRAWSVAQGSTFWVHLAIPTPVIQFDTRLRLDSVMIDYEAGANTPITYIDIWDGANQIYASDRRFVAAPTGRRFHRVTLPNKPSVAFGIVVSIGLQTSNRFAATASSFQTTIISAGGDFFGLIPR